MKGVKKGLKRSMARVHNEWSEHRLSSGLCRPRFCSEGLFLINHAVETQPTVMSMRDLEAVRRC